MVSDFNQELCGQGGKYNLLWGVCCMLFVVSSNKADSHVSQHATDN